LINGIPVNDMENGKFNLDESSSQVYDMLQ
jgi:hypothetical protein